MPVSSRSCEGDSSSYAGPCGGWGGQLLADGTALVDGRAQHVHDAAEGGLADRHRDGCAGVGHDEAATQAVRRAQRNRAHHAITELLLHFEGQRAAFELQGVVHLGHLVTRELHVDHGADTLDNFSFSHGVSFWMDSQ